MAVFLTACGEPAADEMQVTGYVVKVKDSEMTVVAERPDSRNFYDAMVAKTPDDSIRVGQRVQVIFKGPILLSYPGQGSVKSVAILPSRQFDHAHTPLDEVVKKAIGHLPATDGPPALPIIEHVSYSTGKKQWLVQISFGRHERQPVQLVLIDDETGEIK